MAGSGRCFEVSIMVLPGTLNALLTHVIVLKPDRLRFVGRSDSDMVHFGVSHSRLLDKNKA